MFSLEKRFNYAAIFVILLIITSHSVNGENIREEGLVGFYSFTGESCVTQNFGVLGCPTLQARAVRGTWAETPPSVLANIHCHSIT